MPAVPNQLSTNKALPMGLGSRMLWDGVAFYETGMLAVVYALVVRRSACGAKHLLLLAGAATRTIIRR